MRAPAVSPARPLGRPALAFVALMLATFAVIASTAAPAKADESSGAEDAGEAAAMEESDEAADGTAVVAKPVDGASSAEGGAAPVVADAAGLKAGAPTLADYLASGMLRVSADVELASGGDEAIEPVVGSFTVDGLTYAIVGEGEVALVAASPRTIAGGLAGGSDVAPDGGLAGSPAAVPSGEGSDSGAPPRSGAERSKPLQGQLRLRPLRRGILPMVPRPKGQMLAQALTPGALAKLRPWPFPRPSATTVPTTP